MHRILLLMGLLALARAAPARAESGRALLDRVREVEERWDDRHQTLRLLLHAGDAEPISKSLELYETRRLAGGGHGIAAFFTAPADDNRTALLAVSRTDGTTRQWIYVNWQRYARPVSVDAANQRIRDTDLTFGDFELLSSPAKVLDRGIASEMASDLRLDGKETRAVEVVPDLPLYGYRRIRVWFGRDDLVVRRIDALGDDGVLVKRITLTDVVVAGRAGVPRRIRVETPAAGTHTDIAVLRVDVDRPAPAGRFDPLTLERGPW
jgi:hypothetical protein